MTRLAHRRQYDLIPGVDITDEELNNFEMPKVEVGMSVYWWEGGIKTGKRPAIATVTKVSGRNIDVYCPVARIGYDHVRHITDPKIRLNEEQRDMGAWERIPSELRADERLAELEEAVAALQEKVAVLTAGKSSNSSSDYQGLLRRAKKLGVAFAGNPKKNFLVQKIAEAEKNFLAQKIAEAEAAQADEPIEDGENDV